MFKLAGCVGVARRRHRYPRDNIHSFMSIKASLMEFKGALRFRANIPEDYDRFIIAIAAMKQIHEYLSQSS
ncbi:MAG: hypothetical protein V7L01_21500 [Nostoc sp.]|uniref:hypothetical protein n=1 Tax=Nostoc sp. TaxID=1180 RepID=UPI002FF5DB93